MNNKFVGMKLKVMGREWTVQDTLSQLIGNAENEIDLTDYRQQVDRALIVALIEINELRARIEHLEKGDENDG